MRALRISACVLAAIVIISSVVLRVTSSGKADKPEITCSAGDVIEASTAITDGELLAYASAYDEQDGDLTADIVVSRKNFFIAPNTLSIVFAVCDSDNNVATVERKLRFTDYTPPEIILTDDLIFPSGYSFELSKYVRAQDVIDGDITNYVKLISTEFVNTLGTYKVNLKVSNSMADITDITVNAIVTDSYNADVRINLSQYIVYVGAGAELDFASFVSGVNNMGGTRYGVGDVTVDASGVNMSEPGVYDVFYRIYEGRNASVREVTFTRLVVVVREAA